MRFICTESFRNDFQSFGVNFCFWRWFVRSRVSSTAVRIDFLRKCLLEIQIKNLHLLISYQKNMMLFSKLLQKSLFFSIFGLLSKFTSSRRFRRSVNANSRDVLECMMFWIFEISPSGISSLIIFSKNSFCAAAPDRRNWMRSRSSWLSSHIRVLFSKLST